MKCIKGLFIGIAATTLISCGSMPDAVVNYYLPKTQVNITVTQTVSCIDIANPIVKTDVVFKTVYSADTSKRRSIDFDILDTAYSRADATITLTSDGRLTSFNSTSTGTGTDIVDTIIELLPGAKSVSVDSKVIKACKIINKMAGEKDKVPNPLSVSLITVATISGTNTTPKISISPFKLKRYPVQTYLDIQAALGTFTSNGALHKTVTASVTTEKTKQSVKLVEPAIVKLDVVRKELANNNVTTYTAYAPAPQLGVEYTLPIPNPPLFGENQLELSLYESGKIKSLKYGTKNAAKGLGSSIVKLNDQFDSQTNAEKAAELKAEADVMAQQQRIVVCQATPESCE